MKVTYTDIGKQRFSHGKYYYITQTKPIDVVKRPGGFVRRVSKIRYYLEMFKATVKEAVHE